MWQVINLSTRYLVNLKRYQLINVSTCELITY